MRCSLVIRLTPSSRRQSEIYDIERHDQRAFCFLWYVYIIHCVNMSWNIRKDTPPDVRLLTPKPKVGATPSTTTKSKGCAFLEFSDWTSLQQGLRLHHSVLEGRKINVELTAGGGGKSDTRIAKVKERNKDLHGQRVRLHERHWVITADCTILTEQARGQAQKEECFRGGGGHCEPYRR
jgi:hypothetical protein